MSDDLTREARVVDMLLTMHSVLRDRYARRAATMDVAILVISAFLCALTFAEPRVLQYTGMSVEAARDAVALAGVALFALSIAALRVDWKQMGANHSRACEVLSPLKAELRAASGDSSELRKRLSDALADIEPVPERQFIPLKAKHLRKVEVSKVLSQYPGLPVFFATLRVLRREIGRKGRHEVEN